jgi:hypothetical protein
VPLPDSVGALGQQNRLSGSDSGDLPVALAWLREQSPNIVPLAGASRPASIRDSAAGLDLKDQDLEDLCALVVQTHRWHSDPGISTGEYEVSAWAAVGRKSQPGLAVTLLQLAGGVPGPSGPETPQPGLGSPQGHISHVIFRQTLPFSFLVLIFIRHQLRSGPCLLLGQRHSPPACIDRRVARPCAASGRPGFRPIPLVVGGPSDIRGRVGETYG